MNEEFRIIHSLIRIYKLSFYWWDSTASKHMQQGLIRHISWILEQGRINACIAFIKRLHHYTYTYTTIEYMLINMAEKISITGTTFVLYICERLESRLSSHRENKIIQSICLQITNIFYIYLHIHRAIPSHEQQMFSSH